ncbi:uncharacterized protein LOC122264366 [Penaeus japonicus]|uniref:uncharacterized protein LOC122264366 n=1 Tax=Penaeus japonicus TaxID=27405 RepID=UPI001C713FB1|nr:uncharacterized protein LOC122264366 [Penaeus japonicus]
MAFGRWTEAVQHDGRFVMNQVTQRLYEGGDLRPDAYLESVPSLGRSRYLRDFDWHQRQIIESCDHDFDIRVAASNFDVSMHGVLLKSCCGLKSTDQLYKLLKEIVNKRNITSHPDDNFSDINNFNIDEKLEELLSLYLQVLDLLEERCFCNLTEVKRQIRNSIQEKKINRFTIRSARSTHGSPREVVSYRTKTEGNRTKQEENSGWGKGLAVGGGIAVAGAAALGLAALLSSGTSSQEDERKERQRRRESNQTSSKDECSLM